MQCKSSPFGLVVLLAIFLAACATPSQHYVQPKELTNPPSLANSSSRTGLSHWSQFTVMYIDDLPVNYRRPLTDLFRDVDSMKLTQGQHKVLVKSEFDKEESDCPCTALATLHFNAAAGVEYKVVGEILGDSVEFWIIEQTSGKPVTERTRADSVELEYSSPFIFKY